MHAIIPDNFIKYKINYKNLNLWNVEKKYSLRNKNYAWNKTGYKIQSLIKCKEFLPNNNCTQLQLLEARNITLKALN